MLACENYRLVSDAIAFHVDTWAVLFLFLFFGPNLRFLLTFWSKSTNFEDRQLRIVYRVYVPGREEIFATCFWTIEKPWKVVHTG